MFFQELSDLKVFFLNFFPRTLGIGTVDFLKIFSKEQQDFKYFFKQPILEFNILFLKIFSFGTEDVIFFRNISSRTFGAASMVFVTFLLRRIIAIIADFQGRKGKN